VENNGTFFSGHGVFFRSVHITPGMIKTGIFVVVFCDTVYNGCEIRYTELGCSEETHHCQPYWAVPLVIREAVVVHGWIETWGNGIAIPDAQ